MTLVLDTSILISLEKGDRSTINAIESLKETYPSPPAVTFMNYFEFLFGIQGRLPKNKGEAISFIELFQFLDATKKSATILADLKRKYENLGKSFSLSDLLIISQVIENSMTLVTRDKHFKDIDELKKIIL